MNKEFEGNEDWMKREKGRIASKGAMAAERASAGIGCTSDDEQGFVGALRPGVSVWGKPAQKKSAGTAKE